jgi:hypothetical protein
MAEKRSKKSKRPEPKSKKMTKRYESDDEAEEAEEVDYSTQMIEQQQQVMKMSPVPPEYLQKKAPPMKQAKANFNSEPIQMFKRKESPSLIDDLVHQQIAQVRLKNSIPEDYNKLLQIETTAQVPLPPITSIQNLNEILQTKLQSLTIKAFKVDNHCINEIYREKKNRFSLGLFCSTCSINWKNRM